MQDIERAFSGLNALQKQAVDLIEGPLMVVAGPGTGKTQVVALRVANILKKTQVRPSNILCLTYSVSGATAMRERLRAFIGPDAYGVMVTTIHGFCNDVIQSHPEVFHEWSDLTPLSDVQRFKLMNEIIDTLPLDCAIVNPKDRYARTADILSRISEVKREGITLDMLFDANEKYALEMSVKSKPHTKAHVRNLKMSRQCGEFVELFQKYQSTLKTKGLYDYEDMILFVTRALEQEEWLLSGLQERYQYILVDEFQDTNGAQNEVIRLLTTFSEGVRQSPNICVVGDDDQAIYRFQGANVANMLAFRHRFPDCPIVTLTQSYRSTQEILDAASSLISRNGERLSVSIPEVKKNLTSAGKNQHGSKPELIRPVSNAVEHVAIAEQIEDLLKNKTPAGEIAVFTRTNGELFDLYEILRGRSIPVQIIGKLNLLWHSKVLETITMLRAIASPLDDGKLSAAMACSTLRCHPADLGKLWAHQREKRFEKNGKHTPLIDLLSDLEGLHEPLRFHDLTTLIRARDLLLALAQGKESLTLPAMLDTLLHSSGMLPEEIAESAPLDLVALQELYDHIKRRAYETTSFSIDDLLSDIEYRQKYNLPLTYAIPHIIDEGVQLMTAHGAKGLEFDTVFIVNFREGHWDNKRGRTRLSLPDHLIFKTSEKDSIEDERRLAYVAFTRAKRRLILSCPERIAKGEREQTVSPSQFFAEAGDLSERPYELKDSKRASTLLISNFSTNMDAEMKTFIRKKLETFELSVTALNTFLEDPYQFLWEDLLALPRSKDASLAYGTAVHEALYEWGMHAKQGEKFTLERFMQAFSSALDREILSDRDKQIWLQSGQEALPKFYEARLSNTPLIYGLEKKMMTRLDDIPLKGLLDRIDLYDANGKYIRIVDYKTGRPKTEKQIREDFNGSMHRQLVFYKLVSERSPSLMGYQAKECVLEFIGDRDNQPTTLAISVTPEEVKQLSELIKAVWAKIIALDFTPV